MGSRAEARDNHNRIPRRDFIKKMAGLTSVAVGAAIASSDLVKSKPVSADPIAHMGHPSAFTDMLSGRPVTANPTGMDPTEFLTSFDYGKVSILPDGTRLREFEVTAVDRDIEVARGVKFPAWTFNRQVPAPTLRAVEGDRIRIHFRNEGAHPHTIHFHGFHPGIMDGVFEWVATGQEYTYEFTAEPFGLHLYHCHVTPVKKHIAKGLYGTFIVDPKTPREPAKELVMVMNGFDVNFDDENEFYTINGFANYYMEHPIKLKVNELVRIYLVNVTEFDLINSIHTHATFFKLFRTGTRLDQYEYTDTAMFAQGERAVLEFTYKFPGRYMFHAHQSEFQELGWNGIFEVEP